MSEVYTQDQRIAWTNTVLANRSAWILALRNNRNISLNLASAIVFTTCQGNAARFEAVYEGLLCDENMQAVFGYVAATRGVDAANKEFSATFGVDEKANRPFLVGARPWWPSVANKVGLAAWTPNPSTAQ